jgi:dihydropyrimidinase
VFLARNAGCPLYVVHVTARQTVDYLRRLLASEPAGSPVWAETEPHYLTETVDSPAGTLAKVIPPIRRQDDADALWNALAHGTVSTIGSDHVAASRSLKKTSIWEAQLAFPGIATILPVLLSEGVNKGRLSLHQVVGATSTRPARIFGLETKGELAPGRDADFVVVDLDEERVVRPEMLGSRSDFSIYENRRLRGWPVLTVSRARRVSEDGAVSGDEGHGRFLRRTVGGTR